MKVGFIGFGEVNKKLAELLRDERLVTSTEGRSKETLENIKNANLEILPTFKDVALNSDILISATSPKQAIKIAEKYGKCCNGIFMDLNNISPDSAIAINGIVNRFVDAAVIGSINGDFTLFLSGPDAEELNFLGNYFKIKIVSNKVGDASRLKLLRSIYTKSVSAILIEATEIADSLNLRDELLDTIALSEGENFKASAKSRIKNTKKGSKRKKEELLEIIEYFNDYDLEITEAVLEKLSNL